jgi:hypothetical protein
VLSNDVRPLESRLMKGFNVKRRTAGRTGHKRDDAVPDSTVEDTLPAFIKREIPKIRAEIAQNTSHDQHSLVWKFMNSVLGLSILTGVFITGGGAIHRNALRVAQEDRIAEDELVVSTSEFSYRLAQLELFRDKLLTTDTEVSGYQVQGIGRIVRGQEGTVDNVISFKPPLPDFTNKNLIVVIARLRAFGIVEYSEQASQAVMSIENGERDNYFEVFNKGIAVLRHYQETSIAEALRKPRARGLFRRVAGF